MSIVWQNVVDIAPELTSLPVGSQNAILAQVALQMNADVWGGKLDMGSAWLAAHVATVGKRNGAGGAVQSETVGSVSRSYAIMPTLAALSSTAYGLEYERLLMQLPLARIALAGC